MAPYFLASQLYNDVLVCNGKYPTLGEKENVKWCLVPSLFFPNIYLVTTVGDYFANSKIDISAEDNPMLQITAKLEMVWLPSLGDLPTYLLGKIVPKKVPLLTSDGED